MRPHSDTAFLRCIRPACAATFDLGSRINECGACGSLLDVAYDWNRFQPPDNLEFFSRRSAARREPLDFSGVWRFRELLPFAAAQDLVTIGEGQTILQRISAKELGVSPPVDRLFLQYEGLNPSGSFKDNGMAAAFTMARRLGCPLVGCASTGNTSASVALYSGMTRLADGRRPRAVVFIGEGKIAHGKLAQVLDHGALTLQIDGDFDACMKRIREAADRLGLYLMNSINPFRLEGQKTIIYRVLEALDWDVPNWIVVPGGNLGNTSAFGKAFLELKELGLISRLPRLAVVNAAGANTLCELYNRRGLRWNGGEWNHGVVRDYYDELTKSGRRARTCATAIEIARPVNLSKALRTLDALNGVVCEVSDEEIMDAKAMIGRNGLGCEPASAASLAGLKRLLADGVIDPASRVVCILTGHALKDPDAVVRYHASSQSAAWRNAPIRVRDDLDEICRVIESAGSA